MSTQFFEKPILNSPYKYPSAHWQLEGGIPTQKINKYRRKADFITPIPKPKTRKDHQTSVEFDDASDISADEQKYNHMRMINEVRHHVDEWRALPNENDWKVTPHTARLLKHWRHHNFNSIRPFFCQVEAVEVAIWLSEVAPKSGKKGSYFIQHLANVNEDANPGLSRLALKLATGAGKTTVMAMLIAWQTINAKRDPNNDKFTNGFLIVAPGITIKDRLRVLQPNDPHSYYQQREIVPSDMLGYLDSAKIVITNYHGFKLRERIDISKGGRRLLKGKTGATLNTLETEGQMLKRVINGLEDMKNIIVFNDEAHHCYREKASEKEYIKVKGDEKKEVKQNLEAARLWISGLEIITNKIGINRIFDLSATPFFLSGSGYAEGTLFPWTMSDFSLMDAIECGIVKLPRVPVADNIPGDEMPIFRNLWEHIGKDMPKKGRGKGEFLDPLKIPTKLLTALDALYGHYKKTFDDWKVAKIKVPPCFIVVCSNCATSKLVFDYISGFHRENDDGTTSFEDGRLALFSNFDASGKPLAKPNTLLIDSKQLDESDILDSNFREMAKDEIEIFRAEIIKRTGDRNLATNISDADLLREVMNTVGKEGTLGANIRCVVSVSMLTEGWDANTVTHVLGIRAFGTQLLCEQVVGRALRRQSYQLNDDGLFNVEYADVFGIPFDFTAEPVVVSPKPPVKTVHVKAIRPERDAHEIRFPRVTGYRVDLPQDKLTAKFNEDSTLELTPDLVGSTEVRNSGIIGESAELNLDHTDKLREATLLFHLTKRLLYTKWRDANEQPKLALFGQLKHITKQWLGSHLVCTGGTYLAQLIHQELADMACERITAAIMISQQEIRPIKALLDPYNPTGSTNHVNFNTAKSDLWETDSRKSHINWVVLDSDWEAEFCRVAEADARVLSYVKNHSLGFEVPYRYGSTIRQYRPDFILRINNNGDNGERETLNLIVEIKGYRGEDAKDKKSTMDTYWVPGVNNLGQYGRWAFAEFASVFEIEADFKKKIDEILTND